MAVYKINKGLQLFRNAYSLCFFSEPLLVLIEYVPYGDLLGYLRKSRGLNDTYYKDPDIKPQTSLTSQQLMKFAWQIADGMSFLSSKQVSLIVKYFSQSQVRCRITDHPVKFLTGGLKIHYLCVLYFDVILSSGSGRELHVYRQLDYRR